MTKLPEPGFPYNHKLSDGGAVEFCHGEVHILDKNNEEIVMWNSDEWEEDVDAVTATLNAISLALEYGAEAVRARINDGE